MKSKLLVLLIVGLFVAAMVGGCGPDDGVETYTVVAIFPLTGVLSTFGENSSEVAKLAAADVNEWLEEEGKEWRLRLEIDDTQTEGPVGLRKMQSWYGDGVRFFAGPQGSGVAQECLSFANSNQILFISPSSTSPALAIEDDWLYRFCTDDQVQGPAIAHIAKEAGVTHLIFGWRGDTWGDGLQGAAEAVVVDLGIEVYPDKLRYDPLKEEFTSDAALLDEYVADLVDQGVALENIGFNIIAFEEVAPFMAEAARYPNLREITWIGSDGTAVSEMLVSHETAAQFAIDVNFLNSMNRPAERVAQSRFDHVRNHIQETLNRETDSYSYNTYDIIWAFALSFDEVGYDPVAVKEILPGITDEWTSVHGASGHIVLNEAGDRAFADYDLWMLNEDLEWVIAGYYDGAAEVIHWDIEVF